MKQNCDDALLHRRSYYALRAESPTGDEQIEACLRFALKHVPSAFNSQSTRLVLLLHEHHAALWHIVERSLQARVSVDDFPETKSKIETSFASGYGTVLFYEDRAVIREFQQRFPLYAGNFPTWAEHTSAMHQLTIWTKLEDMGFGASLQHYNPLIDKEVQEHWSLPDSWRLIAQMPFGLPAADPDEKTFQPVDSRMRIFK